MGLTAHHLSYFYDGGQGLHDLTFTAPSSQLTVLLGRNGSGKSTLLKVLAGILPPSAGSVEVHGIPLTRLRGRERAILIGYLPQFHQTVFSFTVEDVVLTGRAAYIFAQPDRHDRKKAQEAITRMGIAHLAGRAYTDLSGGERQLTLIARVLAQEAKVILLDEPVSHLDLPNQQRLLLALRDLTAAGIAVMAVLHDPNIAFLHADSTIFLQEGRIVAPPGDAPPWDSGFIEQIYGVTTETLLVGKRGVIFPKPADRCYSTDGGMII